MHMHSRHKSQRVLWLALFLNLFVSALKLIYGLWSSSLSVLADSVHSFADSGASIIGLVSIYFASQPEDDNHHYGHQKFETLAILIISSLITLTAWELFTHAIEKIIHGSEPKFHPIGLAIMLMTMTINILLSRYELRKAKEYNSDILHADAHHTASDFWISFSVLVGLVCVYYKIYWLDSLLTIFIALFLAYTAFKLFKETLLVLSDAAFINIDDIYEIAYSVKGVLKCYNIRTRGKKGSAFVDLSIRVDPKMTIYDAHKLAHIIEDKIKANIPGIYDVLIHTEPHVKEVHT
ncbi:MAG TPA: cation diffusion facilitator family transporter [Oligoflexia bacterium]|nr:cation diffusion facilitator family transporter [Oligoflexia bacterium]HMR25311.1 cation diffusion facilitator family transporter [Oligoflexia bacterium]